MSVEGVPSDSTAYFSIYKIDLERVAEEFFHDGNMPPIEFIVERLIRSIEAILTRKYGTTKSTSQRLAGGNYRGVLFTTTTEPDWIGVVAPLMTGAHSRGQAGPADSFANTTASYVLFHVCNGCIYATTGGYGSTYISKFVERAYGLYLLPKILQKDNPTLKHVTELNLTGNRASTHRTNRVTTSFTVEQDLSSIYRELAAQVDRNIASELGVEFDQDESPKKKLNLVSRNSLTIRRLTSLEELSRIVSRLNALESRPDNFALSHFIPARRKDIPRADLNRRLFESMSAGEYGRFVLVGDDYEKYVLDASRYRVYRGDDTVLLDSIEPITLEGIFTEVAKNRPRLSRSLVEDVLQRWQIETLDNSGHPLLYRRRLIDTIQGFVEYGECSRPCYLIGGDWYVFDEVYSDFLEREYLELFDRKRTEAARLDELWGLTQQADNEERYIETLRSKPRVIVSHESTFKGVEIADAIFWDDSTVYLMHAKTTFDGHGTRDLVNQISVSAEYLSRSKHTRGSADLVEYYDSLCRRLGVTGHPFVSQSDFCSLFRNKEICFICQRRRDFDPLTPAGI